MVATTIFLWAKALMTGQAAIQESRLLDPQTELVAVASEAMRIVVSNLPELSHTWEA